MEIKLLLKEKDKHIVVDNFRTGTLLAQGGAPRGPKGDQGVGVTDVELISVAGVNKTYRMHFSDSSYFDFVVKDGAEGLWGYIEGELANQSDLVSALNSKANVADLATVATTGDYEDLLNQPTIPTDTEDLTNGAGYQTASDVSSAITSGIAGKADANLSNVTGTSGLRKLVETYQNGTSWYKVFAEYNPTTGAFIGNWCEQGGSGVITFTSNTTITFLKQFADTNYILEGVGFFIENNGAQEITKNTTGFVATSITNNSGTSWWRASGYLASGD